MRHRTQTFLHIILPSVLLFTSTSVDVLAVKPVPETPQRAQPLFSPDIEVSELIPPSEAQPDSDWLIDPTPFPAKVYATEGPDQRLVLDNGLIRRVFRIEPSESGDGATVATTALDQLVTGESLLRAVKPETVIELNGETFNVGGLQGQPNLAYLSPDFFKNMTPEEDAFQLVNIETGEPKARFAWAEVRHHAPNAEWPPQGVALRMDYRLPDSYFERRHEEDASLGTKESDAARQLLAAYDFEATQIADWPDVWAVENSSEHPRSSFVNEGKVGEIYTFPNTAVFAETLLPESTRLIETSLDFGTDCSSSWGPGLALLWQDGHRVKFHIRTGGDANNDAPAFAASINGSERLRLPGSTILEGGETSWRLRIRIDANAIQLDAAPQEGEWTNVGLIETESDWGAPQTVRIGKMDRSCEATSYSGANEDETFVRLRILDFAAYSPINQQELEVLLGESEESASTQALRRTTVSVHYELYDGLPVYSKWITVKNGSEHPITVNRFTSELLAAVEYASDVEKREGIFQRTPLIHAETDFAFGGFTHSNSNRYAVHWTPDPDYLTQVNYLRQTPCLLQVKPTVGPDQDVAPGETFESFRAFLLPHDSTERERQGLALRRMYRTLSPWATENPLMMHVRFADEATVKAAIDQCAEVGFEMVILTFGSGFQIENDSPEYLAKMKSYADYAASRGIEIGGYSLLASRSVGGGNDVVSPEGERPTFGACPALTSDWGQDYFRKLYEFYPKTGFMLLEHDGSYPGDLDTTPRPPLQKGGDDSRWAQWRIITDFYKFCRAEGVYLNVPDYYYLSGSNKCGMGYRETNWSLPRAQQVIHTRQNIYAGTWEKTPSMGWMFVPLTQYHGGGAAATIEPLDEHLDHYQRMLRSNLAMGVQACYRGPRLYDTDRTREMVRAEVDWYKRYRDILESDVIHGRRADGRDIDWMMHVNPNLQEKGMAVVFNPLSDPVTRTIRLPLYYTGLRDVASIREQEGDSREFELGRDSYVEVEVAIPGQDMTWLVIE
jgi:hypothetical protein